VNYLQYIHEAVQASTSTPVYSLAAPQGETGDFIVINLNGIAVTESKDQYVAERVAATLFLHYASADEAQNELIEIRHNLQHYPRVMPLYLQYVNQDSGSVEAVQCAADAIGVAAQQTFTIAYMENMQAFYNEQQESIILAADFTFLINY
jgi:uncharacterized protein (DUF1919 family)